MGASIDQTHGVRLVLACGNTITVDAEDVPLALSRKWRYRHAGGSGSKYEYVTASCVDRQVFLHREILRAQPGQIVDHRNGDRTDNRRSNLRFATHAENMRNRKKCQFDGKKSRFRGVSRLKSGSWIALIRDGRKQRYLGTFPSEVAAAFAYDAMSLQLHGDFGRRNFLPLC